MTPSRTDPPSGALQLAPSDPAAQTLDGNSSSSSPSRFNSSGPPTQRAGRRSDCDGYPYRSAEEATIGFRPAEQSVRVLFALSAASNARGPSRSPGKGL
jgi:hypothetical protein